MSEKSEMDFEELEHEMLTAMAGDRALAKAYLEENTALALSSAMNAVLESSAAKITPAQLSETSGLDEARIVSIFAGESDASASVAEIVSLSSALGCRFEFRLSPRDEYRIEAQVDLGSAAYSVHTIE